jgi:hypothetical protein
MPFNDLICPHDTEFQAGTKSPNRTNPDAQVFLGPGIKPNRRKQAGM